MTLSEDWRLGFSSFLSKTHFSSHNSSLCVFPVFFSLYPPWFTNGWILKSNSNKFEKSLPVCPPPISNAYTHRERKSTFTHFLLFFSFAWQLGELNLCKNSWSMELFKSLGTYFFPWPPKPVLRCHLNVVLISGGPFTTRDRQHKTSFFIIIFKVPFIISGKEEGCDLFDNTHFCRLSLTHFATIRRLHRSVYNSRVFSFLPILSRKSTLPIFLWFLSH